MISLVSVFFSFRDSVKPDFPSINVVPVVEGFTLQPVPPRYRKQGCSWAALYNPKAIDIKLIHTFVHAR